MYILLKLITSLSFLYIIFRLAISTLFFMTNNCRSFKRVQGEVCPMLWNMAPVKSKLNDRVKTLIVGLLISLCVCALHVNDRRIIWLWGICSLVKLVLFGCWWRHNFSTVIVGKILRENRLRYAIAISLSCKPRFYLGSFLVSKKFVFLGLNPTYKRWKLLLWKSSSLSLS